MNDGSWIGAVCWGFVRGEDAVLAVSIVMCQLVAHVVSGSARRGCDLDVMQGHGCLGVLGSAGD
jgi:hypothetical protein